MIYFMQLLRMMKEDNRKLLVSLLNDLSFEIEELGYEGIEEELIQEILLSHFGLEFEEDFQLGMFTSFILENQGKLNKRVESFEVMGVI